MNSLPLKGIVVLEFGQYLSAPSAGLRLADFGARVIKIERPVTGDAGRKLAIKNLWAEDGSSLLFHTINRNKDSVTADLKNQDDKNRLYKLIEEADIMLHNFRPGVMEKNGLGYEDARKVNSKIIYAEISGYGKEGPWKNKPGQDLLLQSITGLAYTTGNGDNGPVPFGISIGDILAGQQLVQGVLAALIRRQKTNDGALIEVSLMESLLDFQFELLTTYYATGIQPQRSIINNGHTLLGAPYGLYKTKDGYIALAMMDLQELAEAIDCNELKKFTKDEMFAKRDVIKKILANFLENKNSESWIEQLHEYGLWAMEVFDWEKMRQNEAYKVLEMEQQVRTNGAKIITTRNPIRINGKLLVSEKGAPVLNN
jgi:CoA:oxalate CoA-transferase